MRRSDREIKDMKRIYEIIKNTDICRLGLYDNEEVYIVPLNFGHINNDNKISLFFHGAKEGRKVDIIRKSENVGFEMDRGYEPISADVACGHSSKYQSVIGTGKIKIVTDIEEKNLGMQSIMKHITGKNDWKLPEKAMNDIVIIRLDVEKISCKEHL